MMTSVVSGLFVFLVLSGASESGDYRDALFIARTKGFLGTQNPLKFDYVGVDTKKAYDIKGGTFYATTGGVYWLALSGGARPHKDVLFTLHNDTNPICYVRKASIKDNEITTLSRDIMFPAKFLERFHMESTGWPNGMYSNQGLETSVSMFGLTDLMKTDVQFCVGRHDEFNGATNTILQFTESLVNTGQAFDIKTGYFQVPKDGIYFLSFNTGISINAKFDSTLRNGERVLCSLRRDSTVSTRNNDVSSKAAIFRLEKDDVIFIHISNTSIATCRGRFDISFSGFLYEPVHNLSHAWSVARTANWKSRYTLLPVPFDDVIVNEGNGWDQKEHVYVCPVTGVYYMTVTAGAQAFQPVHINIMADMKMEASLLRAANNHNGMDMLSRSLIVHATKGTLLYLIAQGNTALYSTVGRETSFSGFLLFPYTTTH